MAARITGFFYKHRPTHQPESCFTRCIFSAMKHERRIVVRERFDPYNQSYLSVIPGRVDFSDLEAEFLLEARRNTANKNISDGQVKGRKYFDLFYDNRSVPWFSNVNLPRKIVAMVCRMRADHTSLAESLERKNIIRDPRCRCGHEENLNHVLWGCSLYEEQRGTLLRDLERRGLLTRPPCVESFIASPNLEACLAICRFFEKCAVRV
ncbi:hypothetical protein TKK_0009413 [Trichogramma kaykai]